MIPITSTLNLNLGSGSFLSSASQSVSGSIILTTTGSTASVSHNTTINTLSVYGGGVVNWNMGVGSSIGGTGSLGGWERAEGKVKGGL